MAARSRARRVFGVACAVVAALAAATTASARVVALEVTRTAPAFGGKEFADVGPYDVLYATARYEVDPHHPLNAMLVNVENAPRNARGLVEFDTDVIILKPRDAARGNHKLFFEPVNRGRWLSLDLLNDARSRAASLEDAAAAGNGFLMRRGYTIVFEGWQPPYPGPPVPGMGVGSGSRLTPGGGRLIAHLPIARASDGTSLTGRTTESFRDTGTGSTFIGYLTYPAADIRKPATLRVRRSPDDPATQPAGLAWKYLDEWRIEVTRPSDSSFDSGAIYDFSYEAKDPVVYGLALAAMRDLVSYLRYDARDTQGHENPLASGGHPAIARAFAFGASQTGRTVKTLVYHFNTDEQGRQIFDGVHAHISGASLNSQNEAFGRPGTKGDDRFPFTHATLFDPVSRRSDGWLLRCQGDGHCPKIVHTDSDNEVWTAGGLLYTDTRGKDVAFPANVRTYLFASTQHTPAANVDRGMCQQMLNPLDYRPSLRALFVALDEWVTTGKEPPQSRHPTVAAGTLVAPDRASTGFPDIPGMHYNDHPPRPALLGSNDPPERLIEYPVLVPAVDADGNTRAGIRMPELQVPLATYTGWNLRDAGHGKDSFCIASGSYVPFAATRAAREAAHDPRRSVEERYESRAAYVRAVRRAAEAMVKERLLLQEDVPEIVARAEKAAAVIPR
ncbi:MAG TPA: alpha/beta hydrolase domain-containing protein [Steroidobacteraceae bacterium]|nr:alpha/beta hydrolase domain-containing protein [Steroidobacteraceae bacterium]